MWHQTSQNFLTLTCLPIEHELVARWTGALVASKGIFTLMLAGISIFTFINICAERKESVEHAKQRLKQTEPTINKLLMYDRKSFRWFYVHAFKKCSELFCIRVCFKWTLAETVLFYKIWTTLLCISIYNLKPQSGQILYYLHK